MTANPFDRTVFNVREKPLSPDQNRALAQGDYALRTLMREMYTRTTFFTGSNDFTAITPPSGFIGYGLGVLPAAAPNMTVTMRAGMGLQDITTDRPVSIGGLAGLDDLSPSKPIVLTDDLVVAVPAASTVNPRIDLIEVRADRQLTDPQTRLILDPETGAFNPSTVMKTLQFTTQGVGYVNDPASGTTPISYKVGTPASSPTRPTTTPGYLPLAYIDVPANATTITRSLISDARTLLFPGGCAAWSARWRLQWNGGSPIVTARRISVPAGIQVTCSGRTDERGLCDIFVVGGSFVSCPMTVTVGQDNSAVIPSIAANEAIVTMLRKNGSNDGGASISTGTQAILAAATPPIIAGTQTSFASLSVQIRYQNNGTTNNTATLLEDVVVDVAGVCHW